MFLYRFFKIFPLLNLHQEGLRLFSTHLRKQVHVGVIDTGLGIVDVSLVFLPLRSVTVLKLT